MSNSIKAIKAHNFQGRSFEYDLSPLTAIVGRNMSGKTSIASAIKLALLHYSPSHGNRPNITWGFAGSDKVATNNMGVAIALEHPEKSAGGSEMIVQKWTERAGKITHTGDAPIVPPVLLDIEEEFLNKSGPAKVAMIFSKLDLTELGFNKSQLNLKLRKAILLDRDEQDSGRDEERVDVALSELLDDIQALDEDRAEFKWPVQKWLDEIAATVAVKLAAANTTVKTYTGLVRGSAEISNEAPLKALVNKARLTELRGLVAMARVDLEKRKSDAARRDKASQSLQSIKAELANILDRSEELAELKAKKAKRVIDPNIALKNEAVKSLDNTKIEIARLEASLKLNTEQKENAVKESEEILAHDDCPTCRSAGKKWKSAFKKELKNRLADFTEKIDAEKVTLKKLREGQASLEEKVKTLNKAVSERLSSDVEEDAKIIQFERRQETRDMLKKQFERDSAAFDDDDLPSATNKSPVDCEALKAELATLELQEREEIAETAKAGQAEEARQKVTQATAAKYVLDGAVKVLKQIKVDLMEKGFGSFMESVNLFTAGIMNGSVLYKDGEFGYWRGSTWVAMDHFSGTEKMLTAIGLSIALAQQSPIRLVCVDEWLRDKITRMQVMDRLAELKLSDVIDQAIIIDTDSSEYAEKGYQIINVDP